MHERAPQATHTWRATYNDGTVLIGGPGVGYENIDRLRLRLFEIIRKDSGESCLKMEFQPHQRLIWRRRVALKAGAGMVHVHFVGKQETIDRKNIQGLALVFEPTGTVEFFDRFDPKHPFLREVQLLPFEV